MSIKIDMEKATEPSEEALKLQAKLRGIIIDSFKVVKVMLNKSIDKFISAVEVDESLADKASSPLMRGAAMELIDSANVLNDALRKFGATMADMLEAKNIMESLKSELEPSSNNSDLN